MSDVLLTSGVRRSLSQIRYVTPVLPGAADGLVARVYDQAERDFGLVAAPIVLHSPAPTVLAASWLMLRETLLAAGLVPREQKEAVAAAVSVANACPYCVAVHSAAIRSLAAGGAAAEIAEGRAADIADPALRQLVQWAGATGTPEGGPPPPASGFPELAGVAVTFHYLNRMVSLYLPESPLPSLTPKPMGGWVMGMLASAMTAPRPAPGGSLDLLPPAPLTAEFGWAAPAPHVAEALARATAAIEKEAENAVSPVVRELVLGRLAAWDGRPPGLSRAWADESAAKLGAADRAAGRLALLTVFAPYQVTKADVAEFGRPGDGTLVVLTAWASMAAARTVGSWLPRG